MEAIFEPLEKTVYSCDVEIREQDVPEYSSLTLPEGVDFFNIDSNGEASPVNSSRSPIFFEIATNPTMTVREVRAGRFYAVDRMQQLARAQITTRINEYIKKLRDRGCQKIQKIIKQKLTILPADDPMRMTIGFVIFTEIALVGELGVGEIHTVGFSL